MMLIPFFKGFCGCSSLAHDAKRKMIDSIVRILIVVFMLLCFCFVVLIQDDSLYPENLSSTSHVRQLEPLSKFPVGLTIYVKEDDGLVHYRQLCVDNLLYG